MTPAEARAPLRAANPISTGTTSVERWRTDYRDCI